MIEIISETGNTHKCTTKKWNDYNLFLINKFIEYLRYLLAKENGETPSDRDQISTLYENLCNYNKILQGEEGIPYIAFNNIVNLLHIYKYLLTKLDINGLHILLTKSTYNYSDICMILEFHKKIHFIIVYGNKDPKLVHLYKSMNDLFLEAKTYRANIRMIMEGNTRISSTDSNTMLPEITTKLFG